MSPHVEIGVPAVIVGLKALTVALGGLLTLYAHRAWRRTADPALRALAFGIGIITVGGLLAGLVDVVLPIDRRIALVVESGFTATGFAVLLYSLFVE